MSGSLFTRSLWKQLFPRILWEQTTFYDSAPYYGRLHYTGLCFAHCQDMHGIAPHGDFLFEHQVVCSNNIRGNRLPYILTLKIYEIKSRIIILLISKYH